MKRILTRVLPAAAVVAVLGYTLIWALVAFLENVPTSNGSNWAIPETDD